VKAKLSACLLISLLVFLALGLSQAQKKTPAAAVPDFEVEGVAFTECECTGYACPCRSNGHPEHGSCHAADFVFIQRGHYGNVKLDGLKAVEAGNLLDANPDRISSVMYIDEKTAPEQRAAFVSMWNFMLSHWGEPKIGKVKVVPIQFAESPDRTQYTLAIPGILEEKVVLKRGKDGKPLHTVPAMDQWGNAINYADNVVFKYHDKEIGKSWDLSGRQANVKYFHTSKKIYDNKELLVQHGDMSGTWTAKQREMIQKAGMKVE